jgi:hypothetical protein
MLLPSCKSPAVYQPRKPQKTVLYEVFLKHLETWLQAQEYVPFYVEKELRKYLECGILAHGFARALCKGCNHDFILAFSCKGRGVCPSCNTRRMSEVAAHLEEHLLPKIPMRQWVLSFPKRLRPFLKNNPSLQVVYHCFCKLST